MACPSLFAEPQQSCEGQAAASFVAPVTTASMRAIGSYERSSDRSAATFSAYVGSLSTRRTALRIADGLGRSGRRSMPSCCGRSARRPALERTMATNGTTPPSPQVRNGHWSAPSTSSVTEGPPRSRCPAPGGLDRTAPERLPLPTPGREVLLRPQNTHSTISAASSWPPPSSTSNEFTVDSGRPTPVRPRAWGDFGIFGRFTPSVKADYCRLILSR